MSVNFFTQLNSEHSKGVAFKNINLKKELLSILTEMGHKTVSDLSEPLNLSIPKVKSLLDELMDQGLIGEFGKDHSTGGRRPSLYGIIPESGFFLGIDIKKEYLNLGITDFVKKPVELRERVPYKLSNTQSSLEELCAIVNTFIDEQDIPRSKILGAGLNLSGRINHETGYSYSFFHFHEDPLSQVLEEELGFSVYLENDSRAMAYGEFRAGIVKEEQQVLFLNMDYGIGAGIICNGEMYYGKSGYAGEVGHIPLFDNQKKCHCGKKGCLETEASGRILIDKLQEHLQKGATSILNEKIDVQSIVLEDLLKAAHKDDELTLELVTEMGEKLGRGLSVLINIFNPELIVLGGTLSQLGDTIRLPIQKSLEKYSLSLVNRDTRLRMSTLGNQAGVIGACLLVQNQLLSQS